MKLYRVLISQAVKRPSTLMAALLLSAGLFFPSFLSLDVFSLGHPALVDTFKTNLEIARDNAENADPSMPVELRSLDQQRYQEMRQADESTNLQDFASHLAAAEGALRDEALLGYGSWDVSQEAMLSYLKATAESESLECFKNADKLPGIQYLSYSLATMPAFLWPLVTLFVASSGLEAIGKQSLLARLPISLRRRAFSLCAIGISLPIALVIIATLPSFLLACLRNGLGDPNAVVIYLSGGVARKTTAILAALVWIGVLVLQSCLAFLLAVLFRLADVGSRSAASLAALVVIFAASPMASQLLAKSDLLRWTPIAYSDPAWVTGYFGCWPSAPMVTTNLFQGGEALCLLMIWTVTLMTLAAIVSVRGDAHA